MNIKIFLFRRDLRIEDNLAFNKLMSSDENEKIYPLFIFNPKQIYSKFNQYFSNNCVQFMIESLEELEQKVHINYFEGDDISVLEKLSKQFNITTIAYNLDYSPFAIKRDNIISEWCKKKNIKLITEEDYTLFKMGMIVNKNNEPYKVFTPFYKQCILQKVEKPVIIKNNIKYIKDISSFDKKKYYIQNDNLAVNGGRRLALERMKIKRNDYSKMRDYPSLDKTTKLSAYIKFGCISIREVFYNYEGNKELQRELFWREFYANILYHFPDVLGNSFKIKYDNIKWNNNKEMFKLWCDGKTGYAIVDAGMKQLNETGWMHNRVRMITAMFLTKDLLIDWRWGEKYFATKLVDYDPASNNGGWQWSASTGTDSQPYFRIFNPDLQAKKFDKDHEYINKWNPEYQNIEKIIDHKESAKNAINAFRQIV